MASIRSLKEHLQLISENFGEGDSVKVKGRVQGEGKVGVIHSTAPSGHFHIVKFNDGSKASYHESNLMRHEHDEDEDDDR